MDGTRPDATSKWIVLGVVGSGIFMVTLDSGMLNVALPTLTRDFNEPVTATQWVVLAYLLCVTALLLPIGRLADMVGRKRVFLGGFIVFTIGSALCGLAPSLWLLVAARVLQGIGGAMVQANGAGLVTQAFPASERGRALGLNGAIVSAGLLSGPVIGGLITNWFSWHWLFFVNIPIGIVATIFGFQRLREPPLQAGQRFDAAGAITFLLFVASLLLTLNRAIQSGWADPVVAGLLALTVVSGAVLALVERRAGQPLIDLDLFRNQAFRTASSTAFVLFIGLAHSVILMPFYLQRVLGLSPAQVGGLLVTIPATIFLVAPWAGHLSDRHGPRLLASGGMLLAAAAILSLTTLSERSSILDVILRQLMMGIGIACFQAPNASALFGSLPRERYGVGGAYQSLTRNLGQSIGQTIAVGIWSVIVVGVAGVAVQEAPPEALMVGFRFAFTAAAILVAAGALLSFLGRPGRKAEPAAVARPANRSR